MQATASQAAARAASFALVRMPLRPCVAALWGLGFYVCRANKGRSLFVNGVPGRGEGVRRTAMLFCMHGTANQGGVWLATLVVNTSFFLSLADMLMCVLCHMQWGCSGVGCVRVGGSG